MTTITGQSTAMRPHTVVGQQLRGWRERRRVSQRSSASCLTSCGAIPATARGLTIRGRQPRTMSSSRCGSRVLRPGCQRSRAVPPDGRRGAGHRPGRRAGAPARPKPLPESLRRARRPRWARSARRRCCPPLPAGPGPAVRRGVQRPAPSAQGRRRARPGEPWGQVNGGREPIRMSLWAGWVELWRLWQAWLVPEEGIRRDDSTAAAVA